MKDEDVILGKCVAEEDALKPMFERPYDAGDGWVYGCDRRMFVRIRKELCEGVYQEYLKGSVTEQMCGPRCDRWYSAEELRDALRRCPLVEEETESGEDVECEECDGYGTVECEYWSKVRGKYFWIDCDCPVCEGSGYVERVRTVKTGKMVLDQRTVVLIDGVGFRVDLLAVLADVAGILGVDGLHIVNHGKTRAMVVQLAEGVQFGLMPNTGRGIIEINTRKCR